MNRSAVKPSPPTVSAVIPAHNSQGYIAEAIRVDAAPVDALALESTGLGQIWRTTALFSGVPGLDADNDSGR